MKLTLGTLFLSIAVFTNFFDLSLQASSSYGSYERQLDLQAGASTSKGGGNKIKGKAKSKSSSREDGGRQGGVRQSDDPKGKAVEDPDAVPRLEVGEIEGVKFPRDGYEIRRKDGQLVLGVRREHETVDVGYQGRAFSVLKLKRNRRGQYALIPEGVSSAYWLRQMYLYSVEEKDEKVYLGAIAKVEEYKRFKRNLEERVNEQQKQQRLSAQFREQNDYQHQAAQLHHQIDYRYPAAQSYQGYNFPQQPIQPFGPHSSQQPVTERAALPYGYKYALQQKMSNEDAMLLLQSKVDQWKLEQQGAQPQFHELEKPFSTAEYNPPIKESQTARPRIRRPKTEKYQK